MIGKKLYKAKIEDSNVKILSNRIVGERGNKYKLLYNYKGVKTCYKTDVDVVLFLTKKEALAFLIKNLEHSIEMGKQYIKKEKQQLKEALNFPEE